MPEYPKNSFYFLLDSINFYSKYIPADSFFQCLSVFSLVWGTDLRSLRESWNLENTKTRNPNDFIQALTDLIVSKSQPEKVILFGSYAHGNPTSRSDIDILVILRESLLSQSERSAYLYSQLKELSHYPNDIVVYTLDEVIKWENVRQAFITSIIKKGKVLYEK